MNDPITEIPTAINACAGARSADTQVTAFHHYFTPDSSFLHPLCYVPASPGSRSKIIGIYLFYRAVIPLTDFEIEYVAFDEREKGKHGHVFVDLIQRPWMRGISYVTGGWRPALQMHINFEVRMVDGVWLIEKQEDLIQPMTAMLAFPPLRPAAYLFWWLCQFMGLLSARLFMMLGVWRPEQHLRREKFNGFTGNKWL